MLFAKKLQKKTYDRENKRPVIRCSICTGEQVAGFKDVHTGKFEEIMLIRNDPYLTSYFFRIFIDILYSREYNDVNLMNVQQSARRATFIFERGECYMRLKRKILVLLMAFALVITTITVPAQASSSKSKMVGKTITSGKFCYKVDSVKGKKGTAAIVGARSKKLTSVKIPKTVKSKGYVLTVTGVGDNAFKNYTKLKTVKTNSELKTIGSNAFSGCSKLSKIQISSKKLKSVGKNALEGINKKGVIIVPNGSGNNYLKLLKNKGQTSTVQIQALDGKLVNAAPGQEAKKEQVHTSVAQDTSKEQKTQTSVAQDASKAQQTPSASEQETQKGNETQNENEAKTLPADPEPEVHGHNYSSWEVAKDSNCMETGMEERICSTCGMKETRTIAKKTEHTFGEWKIKWQTSCQASGLEERECAYCGKTETRQIKALPHTLVSDGVEDATCTQRGKQRSHCTVCNQQFFSLIGQPLGHKYEEKFTVDVAATCTTVGFQSRHCVNEGCTSKADVVVIPAIGHTWNEYRIDKEPACTTWGSQSRTCSVCGETETSSISPLGHDYDTRYTVDVSSTCITQGWKSQHCLRDGCDASRAKTPITYSEHDYVQTSVAKEATCVEDGKAIETCNVCHTERTVSIPSVGSHDWGDVVEKFENECVGCSRYSVCNDCGKHLTLYNKPGKGHDWTTTDYLTAKCKDCGISAPTWTNEWARTHCESQPPYELLPKYKEAGEVARIRLVWIVWFRADTTMSEGFHGSEYAGRDGIIDADYKYVMTAPEAKDGYKFVGWVNAGTGSLVTTEKTVSLGWQYMDMTIEAKYQPIQ